MVNKKGEKLIQKGVSTIYKDGVKDDGGAEPGEEIFVTNTLGKILGGGFYDGYGPVSIRIVYRGDIRDLDEALEENILKAFKKRENYPFKSKRIVYADSDDIPGLIIDLYNDIAVIQSSSIGIDIRIDDIKKILIKHSIANYVYLKNTQKTRVDVGLDIFSEWLTTYKKEETIINEGKAKFVVDVVNGQKTGFYLDHRMNRMELPYIYKSKSFLDLYSYTGAFGIHQLLSKTEKGYFVEEDKAAFENLLRNIRLNNLVEKAHPINDKVEKVLKEEHKADLIIIDPPAFAPMKTKMNQGIRKYTSILRKVIEKTTGKVLFISSCSYFINSKTLLNKIILPSLRQYVDTFWILGGVRKASPDHPIKPYHPQLDYLKAYVLLINKKSKIYL